MKRTVIATFAVAAAILSLYASSALARVILNKLVRIVIPLPTGGAVDILARSVGQKLSASLGQPVLIDNRAGTNVDIGTELVARATPDGYTMLMVSTSFLTNHLRNRGKPAIVLHTIYKSTSDILHSSDFRAGLQRMSAEHFCKTRRSSWHSKRTKRQSMNV
ncbi:tripartite tricarboxylate transporter substrate-binding protein [Polaromonas sp.]|uniref:tripartite tricarboxylate transporter substrate-binding protein n=1 Tax=Polaromonas sp. TaxID=1869339 RepID=UPI003267847B